MWGSQAPDQFNDWLRKAFFDITFNKQKTISLTSHSDRQSLFTTKIFSKESDEDEEYFQQNGIGKDTYVACQTNTSDSINARLKHLLWRYETGGRNILRILHQVLWTPVLHTVIVVWLIEVDSI